MSFLKKRVSSSSPGGPSAASAASADALSAFPALCEFLTCPCWPDGTRRVTGSLTVFVDEGRFKVWLSDRDQGLGAVVTISSLLQLLQDVEDSLAEDTVDWRVPKDRKGRK